MPYIAEDRRDFLRHAGLDELSGEIESPGELNYAISTLALRCVMGADEESVGYSAYNAVLGAMEAAKLEFYRRWVVPYEDRKIEENGDIH